MIQIHISYQFLIFRNMSCTYRACFIRFCYEQSTNCVRSLLIKLNEWYGCHKIIDFIAFQLFGLASSCDLIKFVIDFSHAYFDSKFPYFVLNDFSKNPTQPICLSSTFFLTITCIHWKPSTIFHDLFT